MAKKDPFNLGTDARGNFKRALGWKADEEGTYVTHTFYLGRKRAEACVNVVRLEKVWNAVHDRWYRLHETPRACWDETTLEIARAVASGARRVELDYPFSNQLHMLPWETAKLGVLHWLAELRDQFKAVEIEIDLKDAELAERAGLAVAIIEKRIESEAQTIKKTTSRSSGQTLEKALDAYSAYTKTKYVGEGGLTDFGGVVVRRIESIKGQLAEKASTPLSSVNWSFIETWLTAWANRPETKWGERCSVDWARGVVKTIRDFLRWLHRSSDFDWDLPRQYEVLPVHIKQTDTEIADEEVIKKYTREQVGLLWEYGTPRDRLFLLLGLNCGFGIGEIATLRISQIKFKEDGRAYIKRLRTKTKIWGKWVLWPETVAALQWYLKHCRPTSESPYLILTDKGTPLAGLTGGGNKKQIIPNAWVRLRDRIVKDHEDFPALSFNKCRKTGASFMRRKFGDEVAERYLSHGKKAMVDHYAPRDFARLGKALKMFRDYLGDLLNKVSDPFPVQSDFGRNVSVSRGTIKRLQSLRQQGFTLKKVAEELGLAISTIRTYEKFKL